MPVDDDVWHVEVDVNESADLAGEICFGDFLALCTTDAEDDVKVFNHLAPELVISSEEDCACSNVSEMKFFDVIVARFFEVFVAAIIDVTL